LIIQLPILIALYRVFLTGLTDHALFDNYKFLALIDLSQPSFLMVLLATLAQYFQGRLMLPKMMAGQTDVAQKTNQLMILFLGPILTLIILIRLPAALGLYWVATSIFSAGQQIFINKNLTKQKHE